MIPASIGGNDSSRYGNLVDFPRLPAQPATIGSVRFSVDARSVAGWNYGDDMLGAPLYSVEGGLLSLSNNSWSGSVEVGRIVELRTNVLRDGRTEHILIIQRG